MFRFKVGSPFLDPPPLGAVNRNRHRQVLRRELRVLVRADSGPRAGPGGALCAKSPY